MMLREREREVKRQKGNGETKGWKRRDGFKPGVYAHMHVASYSVDSAWPRRVLVPRRGTRNDVDIDFTTDGLVPPLFPLHLHLSLSVFFSRERLSSLARSIVVAAKEAATRNVSFSPSGD